MLPDNIDDLFRQQLAGHATPPSEELRQRLAALAEAERLDALFRTGLATHATPPPRALWERLEDEHLHPQPRRRHRAIAWWQLSAAAGLLLLLLGGVGLWRRGLLRPAGEVAATTAPGQQPAGPAAPGQLAAGSQPGQTAAVAHSPRAARRYLATSQAAPAKKHDFFAARAPVPGSFSSSTSPVSAARSPRPAPTRQLAQAPLPAAATGPLAATGQAPSALAVPATQRAGLALPASQGSAPLAVALTAAPPAAPELVEVDVRRGALATAAVAASRDATPTASARRPRLRLGGLLRQADHLVHGEPVSLAEATGLPETVTVQARLGGRVISKTIQL